MTEVIKLAKCPICGSLFRHSDDPTNGSGGGTSKYRPFCSKRCADVDLGNWFSESYTIPAVELDEQEIKELEKETPEKD